MPEIVSVLIINWNSETTIQDCLEAVYRQSYAAIEIMVWDNHSTDRSVSWLRQQQAAGAIRLFESKENIGFAAAQNRLMAQAAGAYLLSLNSDVFLQPDYVWRLVSAVESDPLVGWCSGKLLRARRMQQGWTTVPVLDSAGHECSRSNWVFNRGSGQPDQGQYDRPETVFGVCAAAAMYTRRMVAALSCPAGEFFDETFFAFYEDVDVDWRAQLQGWRCLYVPAAVGSHVRGGSGPAFSGRKQALSGRNRVLVLLKNLPFGLALVRLPYMVLFECAAVLEVFAIPRIFKFFLRSRGEFAAAVRSRWRIQSARCVSLGYLVRLQAPLRFGLRLRNRWNRLFSGAEKFRRSS